MSTFPFVNYEFNENEAFFITQHDLYETYSFNIWNALKEIHRLPSTLYLIDKVEYNEPFEYNKRVYAYDEYRYVMFYKTYRPEFYEMCFPHTTCIDISDEVKKQYELEQEIPALPEELRRLLYSIAEDALSFLN